MDNNEYLKKLKSQLIKLNAHTREDILNYIRSTIGGEPNMSLADRHGSIYQLTAKHLDEAPDATGWSRLNIGAKWLFVGLIAASVILVGQTFGFFKLFAKDWDDFDYADVNVPEVEQILWSEMKETPDAVDFLLSTAIVYTGDYEHVQYSCNNANEAVSFIFDPEKNILNIDRNKCYLRLPKSVTQFNADQTSLVLAELNSDLDIEVSEVLVRIANNSPITVANNATRCTKDDTALFTGSEHRLTIDGEQCTIEKY